MSERPNILFIVTDQQNARMMSCLGNKYLKTPAMDSIAAHGVRFERAYCTDPVCVPSRFSLLTASDAKPFFMPEPTDGGVPPAWGAGALTYALVEGLAGVHDEGRNMDALRLTPRWESAGVDDVAACVKYEEGSGYVRYTYTREGAELRMQIAASARQRRLEVLLPAESEVTAVLVDDCEVDWAEREVEDSRYACVDLDGLATRQVVIRF